jgi:hypothetical protein
MSQPTELTPDTRSTRLRNLARELCWVPVPLLMLLSHSDFVPLWDGRVYFQTCLMPALQPGASWLDLNCFGHKSIAYMTWIALFQLPDPGNPLLLHISNGLLLGLAVFHFSQLLRRLFGDDPWLPRFLLTGVFAVSPAILGSAINPAPDVGVFVFSVCTLHAFAFHRHAFIALWGSCLVLSKEAGVLTYAGLAVSYAWVFLIRIPMDERMRAIRRAVPAMLVPVAAIAIITLLEVNRGESAVWSLSMGLHGLLDTFLSFHLIDPIFLRYCADVLVLNFHWLFGAVLLTCVLGWTVRAILGLPLPAPVAADLRFVLIAAAVCFYLLTRYRTFNNVRYLLPLFPLVYIAAYHALRWLDTTRRTRIAVLSLTLAGAFVSCFRTVDPVSMGVFGTFRFGDHVMLKMEGEEPYVASGFVHAGFGYGRDSLVYSLEFTRMSDAQNALMRMIDPDRPPLLVVHDHADFFLLGAIDAKTRKRTLRQEGVRTIPIANHTPFLRAQPPVPHAIFVAYPNYDSVRPLEQLAARYDVGPPQYVGEDGYVIAIHELRLRR